MPDRSTGGSGVPDDRQQDREAALGGADAVEKTTYVTGSGTSPEATRRAGATSRVPAGSGQGATWVIIGLLLLGAVLVYLLGFGQ